MNLVIRCTCGQVIRTTSEDELYVLADAHIADVRLDLVGKISHGDLLAMAQEV